MLVLVGEGLSKRISQERFESPVQEAVLNLIVAADHVRRQVEAICEANGISGPQYNVLRILKGVHPDGHPRCEIIRRMLEKAPDVTRLVDRLEQQNLVERVRSEEDRRLSITRISPAGLDLLNTMEPAMQALNRDFAERVSRRDCRELSRICEGIYAGDE
jgi:DNA-binding MarR family transcriptional regulator